MKRWQINKGVLGGKDLMKERIARGFAQVFAPQRTTMIEPAVAKNAHAFIQRYCWIRVEGWGGDKRLIPFKLKWIQRYYAAQKLKAIRAGRKPWFLVLKYRQGGITTYEQALSFHMVTTQTQRHVITIADGEKKTKGIFRIVNRYYDNMDQSARPVRSDSKSVLEYPSLDSLFEFYTDKAQSPGRGFTLSRVHLSEAARYKINREDMEDLIVGLTEAVAKANGEIVAETTAQGVGGWFHDEWVKALRGQSEWTPIFLPWYLDPENRRPCNGGLGPLSRQEEIVKRAYNLDDEQIMFRRIKQAEKGRLFPQEFPEDPHTAFLVSGYSYFDQDIVQAMYPTARDPDEIMDATIVWHRPDPEARYWIAADTAEGGIKSNFSAAVVIDLEGRQCARMQGKWRPAEFARRLRILGEYYNSCLIGVEANNHGHAVLLALREQQEYANLFVHHGFEAGSRAAGKLGWQTNQKTRSIMLSDLDEAMRQYSIEVNDTLFLEQCGTFVDDGTGKYKAREGCYDDLVIAWAIAWQLRKMNAGGFDAYQV